MGSLIVFLVRFNEGIIPSIRPTGDNGEDVPYTRKQTPFDPSPEAHLEEERRLVYGDIFLLLILFAHSLSFFFFFFYFFFLFCW
jgi:hypothetical protein